MYIDSLNKENILILGQSGSGTSYQASMLIEDFCLRGYTVAVFCKEETIYSEIQHNKLNRFTTPIFQKHDLSLLKKLPDIIAIEQCDLVSSSSFDLLISLLKTKPEIKFILTAQILHKGNCAVLRYIDRIFIGRIPPLVKRNALELLDIDPEKLEVCMEKRDFSFTGFPVKLKNLTSS